MVFLHINPSNPNTKLLNDSIVKGKQIFVLLYLEGCGPCNATRPEWKKLENVLSKYKNEPNVVIADVDQSFMKSIKHLKPVTGFPTMRYIKGAFSEDYENSRTIDSLVQWVNSKISLKKSKSTRNNNERKRRHRNTRRNKSKKHRG
jgi:thiol-disulfide isomerase/thioredoxin